MAYSPRHLLAHKTHPLSNCNIKSLSFKEVKLTATTFIKAHKRAAKRTALQSLKDRFDYGLSPEKLGAVSAYLCDPKTAHLEFMLVKEQYQATAGRPAEHGALCYQIRQAFPQGEITPEEANKIGYETAMRWTKGKYQFFVCTHIDKGHIHNHIYYNSTAYDCSRKFRNFLIMGNGWARIVGPPKRSSYELP